ncbi:hypothetical protein Taro_020264, partial [Colocasia esculenta]|nr:hypothetical protein [Colocasia esculenta]
MPRNNPVEAVLRGARYEKENKTPPGPPVAQAAHHRWDSPVGPTGLSGGVHHRKAPNRWAPPAALGQWCTPPACSVTPPVVYTTGGPNVASPDGLLHGLVLMHTNFSKWLHQVFGKEVVFVIDISESMRGRPLDTVISALSEALSELTSSDSFNIIAFNEETYTFSSSLALATQEMVENATEWIKQNCIAAGGTNILKSLDEAVHMLSNDVNSIPHICLITDGAVENERSICSTMTTYIKSRYPIAPRISTFGIGCLLYGEISFCSGALSSRESRSVWERRIPWDLSQAFDTLLPGGVWAPIFRRRDLSQEEIFRTFLSFLLPFHPIDRQDRRVWKWEKGGSLLVRSAYHIISDGGVCHSLHNHVWRPKSPLKDDETLDHLFVGCSYSQEVWREVARRTHTGIGSYCNHYFLRTLATIGRGLYDAAFEADSIDARLQRFFKRISSPILANVTVDTFDNLDSLEVYPSHIPDLLVGCPLILVGRYNGKFSDSLKLKGTLADTTTFSIDLKVQKTKDIPFGK